MKPTILTLLLLPLYFFGQTNTWTGTTDTDWHKTCNWSLSLIPTCAHDVVVPTVTNYPIVIGIAHCKSLSITSAVSNAVTVNSGIGGRIDISSGGGSCSGTATDNGGCILCNHVFSAANLDVGTQIRWDIEGLPTNNGTVEKYCYNDIPAHCAIYGGFYEWEEAMGYTSSINCDPCGSGGRQGICPAGYHIPTDLEWSKYEYCVENTIATTGSTPLSTFQTNTGFRGSTTSGVGPGSKLKGTSGGSPAWDGTNASGFNALPVGYTYGEGEFHQDFGSTAYFLSATEVSLGGGIWTRWLSTGSAQSYRISIGDYRLGFSVRCLQD